jgi:predicted DsbA family dithiol-disulfide isomerase
VEVEIFSDVACPFCYIGKRHFERALAEFPQADEVAVTWRSFQLDPAAPAEPKEGGTYARLASKYGISLDEAEAMGNRVTDMAEAAGLGMDFEAVLSVNTFDAHRMIHFARAAEGQQGTGQAQNRMVEVLFDSYFTAGENLADRDTLVRLAGEAGLDSESARVALDAGQFEEDVRAELSEAMELGLNGVPAFVIGRSLLVSGAQPPEAILGALQQARESALAGGSAG